MTWYVQKYWGGKPVEMSPSEVSIVPLKPLIGPVCAEPSAGPLKVKPLPAGGALLTRTPVPALALSLPA